MQTGAVLLLSLLCLVGLVASQGYGYGQQGFGGGGGAFFALIGLLFIILILFSGRGFGTNNNLSTLTSGLSFTNLTDSARG